MFNISHYSPPRRKKMKALGGGSIPGSGQTGLFGGFYPGNGPGKGICQLQSSFYVNPCRGWRTMSRMVRQTKARNIWVGGGNKPPRPPERSEGWCRHSWGSGEGVVEWRHQSRRHLERSGKWRRDEASEAAVILHMTMMA